MTDDAPWRQWRREGITASDIACTISGLYGGAYAVVADKLGLLPDTEATDDMDRGHTWEGPIADAVATLHNLYVAGEQAWVEHSDHPRHRATVDGFLSPVETPEAEDLVAGLEIKTRRAGLGSPWTYWGAQVQWQMWVTGMPRTLVAGLTIDHDGTPGGLQFRWIDADYSEQLHLVEVAEWLLGFVDRGELPDPQDPSALDVVKAVWRTPDPEPDPVDLSDLVGTLERREALRAAVKAAETELDLLDATIRHRVASATDGAAPGWRVRVSQPTRQLDECLALADHPEWGIPTVTLDKASAPKKALDAYRFPTGSRRLTIDRLETP